MLPADNFWRHNSTLIAIIVPLALGAIMLWLLWGRRQRLKNWRPVKTALDFGPATRKFLLTMFVMGLIALAALWAGDLGALDFKLGKLDLGQVDWLQDTWLRNHAFIPNILAGGIGFLIGGVRP